jgi:hypothetical protein
VRIRCLARVSEYFVNTKSDPMLGHNCSTWLERITGFVPLAIGVVLIAAAILLPTRAFSQPPISITACQKITKAGLYEVDSDLVASVPSVDCLVITAANVSLNLNRFGLFGATSAVGIHVMKAATKALIEGDGSTIKTFGVGIQIDAPGALADNFTVQSIPTPAYCSIMCNRSTFPTFLLSITRTTESGSKAAPSTFCRCRRYPETADMGSGC